MPQDVNFGSYFAGAQPARLFIGASAASAAAPLRDTATFGDAELGKMLWTGMLDRKFSPRSASPVPTETDEFMKIASELEPDGGLPGSDTSDRAARSAAAPEIPTPAGSPRSARG